MSWSVRATGKVVEVQAEIEKQFKLPLADAPQGLIDEAEKQTVYLVSRLIDQCLRTFDPAHLVTVSAHGHMGSSGGPGSYQRLTVEIS
jgi:hypothetical protein